ncbi:MAG: hypothetical protein HKM04_06470 [Legionellales bacterium]|nr:hypothetical protein [Legionellales bacterium]
MKELYTINSDVSIELIETELMELIQMTESILITIYDELLMNIEGSHKQRFVTMLLKQMQEVKMLHAHLYKGDIENPSEKAVFELNSDIPPDDLRLKFTESAFLLGSICHLGAYEVLIGEINNDLANTLSIVNKCTKKIVHIIEQLNLRN